MEEMESENCETDNVNGDTSQKDCENNSIFDDDDDDNSFIDLVRDDDYDRAYAEEVEKSEMELPDKKIRKPRRTLLYHIAAMLDVNECQFDFLKINQREKEKYFEVVYAAVIREVVELDKSLKTQEDDLKVVFRMFHKCMSEKLEKHGRKEANESAHVLERNE